jgi:hypothetical protein
VEECFAKCDITVNSEKNFNLGGIVGQKNAGTILNCYSEGEINAKSENTGSCIGGIAGVAATTQIYGVYRVGNINSSCQETKVSGITQISKNKILDGAYYEGIITVGDNSECAAISAKTHSDCYKISNIFYFSNLENAFTDEYSDENVAKLSQKINTDVLYNILENSVDGINWKKDGAEYPKLFWE